MINLSRSFSLCLSSACKQISNQRDTSVLYCSHTNSNLCCSQVWKWNATWKSSFVSHFLLPADLWPCCTSVVPALAAAQHPPGLPGVAAEHPNEKEGQIKEMLSVDLKTDTLRPPAPAAHTTLYSSLSLKRMSVIRSSAAQELEYLYGWKRIKSFNTKCE